MNISDMIKALQATMEVFGDLPVTQLDDGRLVDAGIKVARTDHMHIDSNETGIVGEAVIMTNWEL